MNATRMLTRRSPASCSRSGGFGSGPLRVFRPASGGLEVDLFRLGLTLYPPRVWRRRMFTLAWAKSCDPDDPTDIHSARRWRRFGAKWYKWRIDAALPRFEMEKNKWKKTRARP